MQVMEHLGVLELSRMLTVCRFLSYGQLPNDTPLSLVEECLRQRATSLGMTLPQKLPLGETSWVQALLHTEAQRERSACTVSVGQWHSLFVDIDGNLLSCGVESAEDDPNESTASHELQTIEPIQNDNNGQVNDESIHHHPTHYGQHGTSQGLLGHGILKSLTEGVPTPRRVHALSGIRFRSVSAGTQHSLAVSEEGALFSWGCGGAWLGHGSDATTTSPTRVMAVHDVRMLSAAAGDSHSLALSTDGAVYSWGARALGTMRLLGHGMLEEQSTPMRLETLRDRVITAISAAFSHSLAVDFDGNVWSWGQSSHGQLGHGTRAEELWPREVIGLRGVRVVNVAAGDTFSLALSRDGKLYSWGRAQRAGHDRTRNQLLPRQIKALAGRRVRALAARFSHALVTTEDGALFSWGAGSRGQLGHGDLSDQRVPRQVEALAHLRICNIAVGSYSSVAVDSTGRAWAWAFGSQDGPRVDAVLGLKRRAVDNVALPMPLDRSLQLTVHGYGLNVNGLRQPRSRKRKRSMSKC